MSTALVKKDLTAEEKQRCLALAADGVTWASVLEAVGMTQLLFWKALRRDPVFAEDYATARIAGLHMRSDELLTAHIGAADLMDLKAQELYSKNLQWVLSRRLRQEYGDQVHISTEQRPNARKVLEAIDAGLGLVAVAKTVTEELEESEEEKIRRLYSHLF